MILDKPLGDILSFIYQKIGNVLRFPFPSETVKPRSTFQKSDEFQLNILALNWRCLKHPLSGGSEVNIFEQSKHWVDQGHNVTLLTSHPGQNAEREENYNGINIIRMGGRLTVYLYVAFYLLLNSHQYDVILDISNGIPFFAPLFTRKPTVLLVHHVHREQWFYEFPNLIGHVGWFLESRFVPFLYRKHRTITVSPTTEEEMLKIGFKSKNLYIVFNGLNVDVMDELEETASPRVVYIGRLKSYKRIHLLIEAIDKLRHEFPNIQLDIAGKGDTYDELVQQIQDHNLENHITMHGFVSDEQRTDLLRSATLFATPSMQEGWGISVIEANAHGCPAVAYDVPGLQASIPNNETGLLATDHDDFTECIARIIRDEALRKRLSNGALYWASLFDWKSAAMSTLSIMHMDMQNRNS